MKSQEQAVVQEENQQVEQVEQSVDAEAGVAAESADDEKAQHQAAVKIQSVQRGRQARKEVAQKRAEVGKKHEDAAASVEVQEGPSVDEQEIKQ